MDWLEGIDLDTSRKDFFQDVVAVLIMLTTMFGALVVYLETDASTRADRADRQSQVYAIQAMGQRLRATQRNNFEIQVYAATHELDQRATNAMEQAGALSRVPGMSAGLLPYQIAAERWRAARDRIRTFSTLLNDMRFQPAADIIRFDQYFEESLILARSKAEWQRATALEAEAWDNKARGYLSIVTILAVALFLFGLSLTIPGTVRRILVAAGIALAVVSMGWAGRVYAQPVPAASEEAIQAYLRGVAALNTGDYPTAIASFDEALTLDVTLGGAWADRGYARIHLNDPVALQPAIADFEQAIRLGVDNPYTRRNVGRLYVKLGRFDQAITHFEAALAQDANQPMLYFDLGLARFVGGQDAAAREAYQQGIALLAQQPGYVREPCFQAAIHDLQDASMMGDRLAAGADWVRWLKEAASSLALLGEMAPHDMGVQFGPLAFTVDKAGLAVTFTYQDMQDGLAWQDRWYVNGQWVENLSPPREPWSAGPSGEWTIRLADPTRLRPGTYRVELYVEGRLVQAGETTLNQDLLAAPQMMPMYRYASDHLALSLVRPGPWRLVGGGADHEFVAFAGPRDMAFFIVTTRRYDLASSSAPEFQALSEELESLQQMHGDLQPVGETTPIQVGGRTGIVTHYRYSDGTKRLTGQAIAVTTEAGRTYRIRFEALEEAFADHAATFEAMLNSLTLE